jgi:hypothetical protein
MENCIPFLQEVRKSVLKGDPQVVTVATWPNLAYVHA